MAPAPWPPWTAVTAWPSTTSKKSPSRCCATASARTSRPRPRASAPRTSSRSCSRRSASRTLGSTIRNASDAEDPMNIYTLAERINQEAARPGPHAYRVGELQHFRAKVHRKGPHTYKIFSRTTIKGTDGDHYAFHDGGRSELQFN